MPHEPERAVPGWMKPRQRARTLPVTEWDGADTRPRVLVECDDRAVTWAMESALARAGYEVASCPGPSSEAPCALVETGGCDLQAGADVIVNCLDSDARTGRPLAHRTVETYPEHPLVVDVTPISRTDGSVPEGATPLVSPWSSAKLVTAVDAALADTEPAPGAPG